MRAGRAAGALGRAAALATALLLAPGGGRSAAALPSAQAPVVLWSEPRLAWETTGRCSSPILVTDAWGRVHLFFLNQEEGEAQNTLYHVEAANEDARPVDILVGVTEYRVAADAYGSLHLLTLGANDLLHHSRVPATEAGRAGAWTARAALGSAGLGSDLIADDRGGLHLCYPRDHAVYHQFSADGGATWSEATHVADMDDPAGVATYVRCAVDATETLHLAWAEVRPPDYYPPEGVSYSRGSLRDASWSPPEQLAGQHFTLPGLLADPRGQVHLMYQGDVEVGGRYYQQRPAGMEGRWSPAETVVPAGRGGMSGDSVLALDSRGDLHAGLNIDGIYWAVRRQSWSAPLDLSAPLRDPAGGASSMEQATLAIANGNELFVGFEKDFKRIYLRQGQSDAPAATSQPPPTAVPMPRREETSPGAEAVAATAAAVAAGGGQRPLPPDGTAEAARRARALAAGGGAAASRLPSILGGVLALALVAGMLWRQLGRRHR